MKRRQILTGLALAPLAALLPRVSLERALADGTASGEGEQKNPWDIAAYFYQEFWQAQNDPNRNAAFFIGGTGGPDNPQFAQWNIFASIEAFGPMASRVHDRMGVAGWYNALSDNFTDLAADVGTSLRDLWGVELYYNFAINKWLHLTPDLQFAGNEFKGDDVAVIPGIRLVMDF